MIHSIRRVCSALCLAICFSSLSNAQTVNADGTETTDNLIGNNQWTGAVYGTDPNDCCSNPGGSQPLYDIHTNTIKFSYGQATVGQVIGINNALSGSGIQVNGYLWQYDARNMNGGGGQNGTDTLTSYSYLMDGRGALLASNTITHNTQFEWTTFSGTQTLANPYSASGGGIVGIQFSGMDGGFWAGLYGPEVRNVSLRLNYTAGPDPCVVDPLSSTSCPGYAEAYKSQQCSINPLYDTSCPGYAQAYHDNQCTLNPLYASDCVGYSSVVTGPNVASSTTPVNLATALSHSGAGLTIYGFNYGFDWRRQSGKCYDSFLFFCTDYRTYSSVKPNLHITDSNGNAIINRTWNFSGDGNYNGGNWNSVNETTIFYGTSYNSLNLGYADWDANTSNVGAVRNYFLRPLMAPDQCAVDPLSNTACSGYAAAFLAFQCSISSLYSPECPGYTTALQAMLDEQAALAASATPTADPVATVAAASTTSSAPVDESTKDQTEVTTDVGGAELSSTGEIQVSDGIPSDVKESVKESTASTEKKEETKTETATAASSPAEKKTSKVNAVALAQAAARDAEKTALSVAGEAQAASLSDNANPADGIGLTGLGSGITIPGLQILQGLGNANNTAAADNQALASVDRRDQRLSAREETATVETAGSKSNETKSVDLNVAAMTVEPRPEPVAPTGPSVRRGGAVDGMSGGDMNALAAAPANFNDYLTQQIQDAQFYASKEIYRGQRNVDNARALRGLGTDRLHQQMVDQQYNISGQ